MNFVTSISLVVLGAMFLALLGWGSIRAAWRNCEGRRGVFAALAILAAICSIVAQKPSPDTPTITVDALLRDVGCYATNNVFHAAVTNAPSYAGVDFSDCDLMVYARERASTNAASWFELTPRKKFSQQPADYAIENATNFNYMVYLNYVPPSPVHTNGVFELYGFVIENEAQGEPDQLAAGFINSRAVTIRDRPYDAEVEYLESTGRQWIDTGFKANTTTTRLAISVEFTDPTSNQGVFGSRNEATGNAQSCNAFVLNPKTFRPDWAPGSGDSSYKISILPNTVYDISITRGTLVINGETHTYPSANSYDQSYNFLLFNFSNSGNTPFSGGLKGKVRYAQLYSDGVLIRDFIPVRVGTTGVLYDKRGVGGMNPDGSARNDGMYFNRGTGNFGYGNDK